MLLSNGNFNDTTNKHVFPKGLLEKKLLIALTDNDIMWKEVSILLIYAICTVNVVLLVKYTTHVDHVKYL